MLETEVFRYEVKYRRFKCRFKVATGEVLCQALVPGIQDEGSANKS